MSLNFALTRKRSSLLQQFSVSSQRKKVYIRCELLSVIYGAVMIEVSGFMTDPADSNYSPNTNATDNSPLIDLVINATHRYAATKGSPERLDLSW